MDERAVVRHLTAHLSPSLAACVADRCATNDADGLHGRMRLALRRCIRDQARAAGRPVIHAAAAELAGTGVLMPGRTRAGKSTLAMALARHREAGIGSDDLVLVDGTIVEGFGAPISVRGDSPYAEFARALWYSDRSDRLLVRADDAGARAVLQRVPFQLIAFPQFGERNTVRPLTPAASFCRLLSSVIFPIDFDLVLQLARSTAQVNAVEMSYESSGEALRQLDDVLGAMIPAAATAVDELPPDELGGFRDAVRGLRFATDEVVVIHPRRRDVVLFERWPAGVVPEIRSWSAMVGGRA